MYIIMVRYRTHHTRLIQNELVGAPEWESIESVRPQHSHTHITLQTLYHTHSLELTYAYRPTHTHTHTDSNLHADTDTHCQAGERGEGKGDLNIERVCGANIACVCGGWRRRGRAQGIPSPYLGVCAYVYKSCECHRRV